MPWIKPSRHFMCIGRSSRTLGYDQLGFHSLINMHSLITNCTSNLLELLMDFAPQLQSLITSRQSRSPGSTPINMSLWARCSLQTSSSTSCKPVVSILPHVHSFKAQTHSHHLPSITPVQPAGDLSSIEDIHAQASRNGNLPEDNNLIDSGDEPVDGPRTQWFILLAIKPGKPIVYVYSPCMCLHLSQQRTILKIYLSLAHTS